jgi:MoxR-like ATPase
VHDYLKGIEVNGRLGVLYSNKDYGCEWDYDWRNKRFLAEDNTKFCGEHRDVCVEQLALFLQPPWPALHLVREFRCRRSPPLMPYLSKLQPLRHALGQAVVGQHDVVEQLLIGLLAGGHVLLEGAPGLGKTLLVRSLGQALELQFRRVQFTPDLMPSDILGTELLEEDHGTGHRHFRFQQGPIFTNLLLADELNRTPPKTQAALLEAMQERTVSYAGTTYSLPAAVLRAGHAEPDRTGRYLPAAGSPAGPLPAARAGGLPHRTGRARHPGADHRQQQRFGAQGDAGRRRARAAGGGAPGAYQRRRAELDHPAGSRQPPGTGAPDAVNHWVKWGAGPRAGQALVLAAKARALLQGRFAATRDDVQALMAPVLRHRMLLSFAAEAEQKSADDVIAALLQAVPFPA